MMIRTAEPIIIETALDRGKRQTYSLNGIWEVCQADFNLSVESLSKIFHNTIPVPGLMDLAEIPLTCNALWYKKTLIFKGQIPKTVILKIGKAFWGKYVFLNGVHIEDHHPNFTPAYIDITDYILGGGFQNVLHIKIGAKGTQPHEAKAPAGYDFEKIEYIPGIYDDVCLIITDNPYFKHIQAAPRILDKMVCVRLTVTNTSKYPVCTDLKYRVCEKDSQCPIAELQQKDILIPGHSDSEITINIPMQEFELWSPESPVLYDVYAQTAGDEIRSRFGMREFYFDSTAKRGMLNGKSCTLRGTNISMYRFFEDPRRGTLPWNLEWAKKVLLSFKRLNMNSMRFCIGFPPELWYELADEIGFLIQDEYPIWGLSKLPENVTDSLIPELVDWIQERANHPCVVIWDIQNETIASETFNIIRKLREMGVDLSDRPWDNGWAPPAANTDPIECHPYLFVNPFFTLSQLNRAASDPALYNSFAFHFTGRSEPSLVPDNPRIINEYSWLWLNRDGTPTSLTRRLYDNLMPESNERQRRDYFAAALAQLTEFWRAGGKVAGVMDFCGLTYCKAQGATCDYFLPEIEEPSFDPLFEKMMSDAMAPMGIVIEEWSETQRPGNKEFPVSIINDTNEDWEGDVCLTLQSDHNVIDSVCRHYFAPASKKTACLFQMRIPDQQGTRFRLTASYEEAQGDQICSVRYFVNGLPVPSPREIPISRGKTVEVSTSGDGSNPSCLVSGITGNDDVPWWNSRVDGLTPELVNSQQVTVDLGQIETISQIWITWGMNFAKVYEIEFSSDHSNWHTAYREENGTCGLCAAEVHIIARYVRLNMIKSVEDAGYSLFQIEVF